MNIQTVLDNLDNTIAGKEALLATLDEKAEFAIYPKTLTYKAAADMLELNINELKRIRADVALCPLPASAASSCA